MKKITIQEFKAMNAKQRGYCVYLFGANKLQPNVPDEQNPYKKGTRNHKLWDDGAFAAMLAMQDIDE